MRPGPRLHHDDAVGERHRLLHVVRDDDDRRAVASHSVSRCSCRLARVKASSAEKGSSSSSTFGSATRARAMRDALLLAAGEFARPAVGVLGEADAQQRIVRRASSRSARGRSVEAKADIVRDREPGQQPRLLEHDADAGCGAAIASPSRRIAPALAWSSPATSRSSVRLAAARAADEREDLAVRARSRPTSDERPRAVGIGLGEVLDAEHHERLPRACPASAPAAACRRPAARRRVLPSSAKAMMAARIWSGLPICWPSTSR